MRLKTKQPQRRHTKMVTAVGWTPSNELFSFSDDKSILKWNFSSGPTSSSSSSSNLSSSSDISKLVDLDAFVTDAKILSSIRGGSIVAEVFVVGCSDGTFKIFSTQGRLEKSEKAHNGAITSLCWNQDGSVLLTAGEDGCIKQWSRSGNLRSKLVQETQPIYSLCFSADNNSIIYACGRNITIKNIASNSQAKPIKWIAHDSTILKLDCSYSSNLIISGGEDGKYKIWDSFGLCLYSSKPFEFPITSLQWSPNGEYFAVGSFNSLTLADKTGWAHSRSTLDSGSIMSVDWSSDSTLLSCACANGGVVFAQVVDRKVEWRNYECVLDENNHILVTDVLNESALSASTTNPSRVGVAEDLEFGHAVLEMSIGWGHLIVITANKNCYIYNTSSFSTPHIFDTKGNISLILQTEKYFLLNDRINGLKVFTYEGKTISTPKISVQNTLFAKQGTIALSNDALAVIDRANPTQIHILDPVRGGVLVEPLKHDLEVIFVGLSTYGTTQDRKIIFIDRNQDLFITNIYRNKASKIATMVDSASFHEGSDILCAVSDGKLVFWYYPSCVSFDADLLQLTKHTTDSDHSIGKGATFVSFSDNRVVLRKADGALANLAMSPFPPLLYAHVKNNNWTKALRLCRFVGDNTLWAVLAAMSITQSQLDTAEISLSQIEEIDKLQHIQEIKGIPSLEGRNAELLFLKKEFQQAEEILINSDLIYRAIKMNINLFKWNRALELAVKHKTHVDTVLGFRSRYLQSLGRQETEAKFLQMKDVAIDWSSIELKIQQEHAKEVARGTPYRSIIPELQNDPFVSQGKKSTFVE